MRFLVYAYVITVIACGLLRLFELSYAAVKGKVKNRRDKSPSVHNFKNSHIIEHKPERTDIL